MKLKQRNIVDVVLVAALLNSIMVGACAPQPNTPDPSASTDAGAASSSDASSGSIAYTCANACTHLRILQCSMGKPTPRGATCEKVCQNVQDNNAGAGFNVTCMSKAKSCDDAENCK